MSLCDDYASAESACSNKVVEAVCKDFCYTYKTCYGNADTFNGTNGDGVMVRYADGSEKFLTTETQDQTPTMTTV